MALSEFPRLGFDPFVELRRMQTEMSRLFSGFSATTARDFPPINILLGENSVAVIAELPGVTADDVTIGLQEVGSCGPSQAGLTIASVNF